MSSSFFKRDNSGARHVAAHSGRGGKSPARPVPGTRVTLTWSERGQSGFSPPSRSGFGTKLIDMTITRELGGTIMRDFQHDGLRIDIEIPLVD